MRPNQQFGQKNIKQDSTNASGQISLRIFFLVLRYINNETQICKKNLSISQEEYSLCLIGSFIGLCPHNSTETSKAWCATYFRRITNNTFYRTVKIILCVWRVGDSIFPFGIPMTADAGDCRLREFFEKKLCNRDLLFLKHKVNVP